MNDILSHAIFQLLVKQLTFLFLLASSRIMEIGFKKFATINEIEECKTSRFCQQMEISILETTKL